jgi:chromosome segregation ATPase
VESTADWKRFRLPVDTKQTASLTVEEARVEQVTYALTNITDEQVALFVRQQSINKTIEDALRQILAQKAIVAELDSQKSARDDERDEIFNDQQRLRENMKSLRGSAEEKKLLERYTEQLNAQETRLATLHKESQDLDAQRDKAQAALDRMIEELSFDVKM